MSKMYDELVKQLREHVHSLDCEFCDRICCYPEGKSKSKCVIIQAADAIEELQRQIDAWVEPERKALLKSIPKWIPVSERLPGREWVLCKCRTNIHEVLSLRDGCWYHDPQHQYMSGFVTHWMPLPQPPKEGKR